MRGLLHVHGMEQGWRYLLQANRLHGVMGQEPEFVLLQERLTLFAYNTPRGEAEPVCSLKQATALRNNVVRRATHAATAQRGKNCSASCRYAKCTPSLCLRARGLSPIQRKSSPQAQSNLCPTVSPSLCHLNHTAAPLLIAHDQIAAREWYKRRDFNELHNSGGPKVDNPVYKASRWHCVSMSILRRSSSRRYKLSLNRVTIRMHKLRAAKSSGRLQQWPTCCAHCFPKLCTRGHVR